MKKVLFSANDLGGAQAILPVVVALRKKGWKCAGILTGPARGAFKRPGVPFDDGSEMADEMLASYIDTHEPDVFLAGRSVAHTVDKRMLPMLKERDIKSLYVLDFWNYYSQWFSDKDKDFKYLPTIICVMDEMARADMLSEGFPPQCLRVTGNPHFEHFSDGIPQGTGEKYRILFISQPISMTDPKGKSSVYGFNEHEVFKALLLAWSSLPNEFYLQIRLHPKEDRHRYDEYLNERVTIAQEPAIEEAIAQAGLVVGMFSPVLMQALAAGKPIISYEPNLVGADPLPTNRLGLTNRLNNEEELADALLAYADGRMQGTQTDLSAIWPPGATERIIAELYRSTK
ncbi:hypothetical protein HY412_00875 [Candidatus Kaiserbacteria bacterium]|nr:hypothetical protein [Candidatus Kaiserbacteria bacterium]